MKENASSMTAWCKETKSLLDCCTVHVHLIPSGFPPSMIDVSKGSISLMIVLIFRPEAKYHLFP